MQNGIPDRFEICEISKLSKRIQKHKKTERMLRRRWKSSRRDDETEKMEIFGIIIARDAAGPKLEEALRRSLRWTNALQNLEGPLGKADNTIIN